MVDLEHQAGPGFSKTVTEEAARIAEAFATSAKATKHSKPAAKAATERGKRPETHPPRQQDAKQEHRHQRHLQERKYPGDVEKSVSRNEAWC